MPPARTSPPAEIVWTLPNSPANLCDVLSVNTSECGTGGSKHSKKKPASHIPRPPNAFILFRSSFIKSQHVSTDVETNHSTLSKIIGMTWQGLPDSERQIWHDKARAALDEHRRRFPAYAFRPAHSSRTPGAGGGGGEKRRKVREVEPKDTKRCAKIAALLVDGLKGAALDQAIREFDKTHVKEIITRFETPITESAFKKREKREIVVDVKREPEADTTPPPPPVPAQPPSAEEYVDQQMYYPEQPAPYSDTSYCHTPTSPYPQTPIDSFTDAGSYPCSPIDGPASSYPSPMSDNFFNPEYINSVAASYPPAPSYDALSPPSYEPFAHGHGQTSDQTKTFTESDLQSLSSLYGSPSDMFTFELPGVSADYLTEYSDLLDFEMPTPLNPTWNVSTPAVGY